MSEKSAGRKTRPKICWLEKPLENLLVGNPRKKPNFWKVPLETALWETCSEICWLKTGFKNVLAEKVPKNPHYWKLPQKVPPKNACLKPSVGGHTRNKPQIARFRPILSKTPHSPSNLIKSGSLIQTMVFESSRCFCLAKTALILPGS